MSHAEKQEDEFSLKNYFVPLTTSKAVHFIVIIGFLVYGNALFNQFVWDDIPQLVNNTLYHSLLNFVPIMLDHTSTYYRPLPAVVFSALYSLFGATPFWYHLFQIALHIGNTIVLFVLFQKKMKTTIAFILSLIFLVHPINVEAVSYIASLQIVLSMFFGLMAFLVSIQQKRTDISKAVLIFSLVLCSLLSKETGIIFLILLLPFMRLFSKTAISHKEYLYTGLTSGFSAVVYLLLRFVLTSAPIVTDFSNSPVPMMQATIAERLMTLPRILYFYIETLFFPLNLAISQNWMVKTIDQHTFFIPLIVTFLFMIVLIAPAYYFFIKRKKVVILYVFFLIWFFVSWVIHWNIIPLDMTVAERWFYFALAGLLGLVGVVVNSITVKIRNVQSIAVWAAIVLLVLLSVRTIQRNQDFSTPLTLYAHDAQISTESFDLENSYAMTLLLEKRYDEAYPHIQKSIKLAPEYWENWSNLGVYYEGKGQIDQSIDAFSIAITKNKYYHHAYMNLANMYFYHKSPESAKSFFTKALSVFPNDPQFLLLGSVTEYKLGYREQAMAMVMHAYTITKDPKFLNAYQEMQQNVEIK